MHFYSSKCTLQCEVHAWCKLCNISISCVYTHYRLLLSYRSLRFVKIIFKIQFLNQHWIQSFSTSGTNRLMLYRAIIFTCLRITQNTFFGRMYGIFQMFKRVVESSRNVMAHGDGREGKWRGNWWMEWATSTFHTTSEHGVSSMTIADAHTSAASSRLNWRPRRFKLIRPFRRKTKSGFCACAITFPTQSTTIPWYSCSV